MAKQKYLEDVNGNKIYPIGHTKAIYDNDGIVLENRLANMKSEAKSYTDTKVANLVNGAPETLDTLKEVADAIEANQDVVSALDDAIGNRANKTDVELALNNKADKTDVTTALSGKLDTDGNSSDTTVTFEEISTRNNINSGEKQSVLWGKVKKWFGSLKPIAFSSNYNDLNNAPEIPEAVAVKGDNESIYRTGNVNITKDNIGLGNVPNVTTDDQTPAYTQATTRENITSGEKLSVAFGKIKKWFADLKTVAFTGSYTDLTNKPTIPKAITVDSNLSSTSTNPVQNKVIKQALDNKADTDDIPDLSQMPTWEQTGSCEYTTQDDLCCNWLGVTDGNLCFNSNGYINIDEVTQGVNDALNKANIEKDPEANDGDMIHKHLVIGSGNNALNSGAGIIAGWYSKASSNGSAAIAAYQCNAALWSFVSGSNNNALDYQFKLGHFAKDGTAGQGSGTTGDAFIIGNGTSTAKSNAFRVTYAGNAYGKAAYNTTGADYAEMFEWADGNPNSEDRCGLFAYIENGKMRLASADDLDKHRLGIISARPAIVGDNFDDEWHGKYLTDIFGREIMQSVHHNAKYRTIEEVDSETGEVRYIQKLEQEAYDATVPMLNPDYDPEREYIPRAQRKEYDCWAFLGKLVVRDDGTCQAGGYCYPSTGGIATVCDDESKGFYVMERLDNNHIKVLIK